MTEAPSAPATLGELHTLARTHLRHAIKAAAAAPAADRTHDLHAAADLVTTLTRQIETHIRNRPANAPTPSGATAAERLHAALHQVIRAAPPTQPTTGPPVPAGRPTAADHLDRARHLIRVGADLVATHHGPRLQPRSAYAPILRTPGARLHHLARLGRLAADTGHFLALLPGVDDFLRARGADLYRHALPLTRPTGAVPLSGLTAAPDLTPVPARRRASPQETLHDLHLGCDRLIALTLYADPARPRLTASALRHTAFHARAVHTIAAEALRTAVATDPDLPAAFHRASTGWLATRRALDTLISPGDFDGPRPGGTAPHPVVIEATSMTVRFARLVSTDPDWIPSSGAPPIAPDLNGLAPNTIADAVRHMAAATALTGAHHADHVHELATRLFTNDRSQRPENEDYRHRRLYFPATGRQLAALSTTHRTAAAGSAALHHTLATRTTPPRGPLRPYSTTERPTTRWLLEEGRAVSSLERSGRRR